MKRVTFSRYQPQHPLRDWDDMNEKERLHIDIAAEFLNLLRVHQSDQKQMGMINRDNFEHKGYYWLSRRQASEIQQCYEDALESVWELFPHYAWFEIQELIELRLEAIDDEKGLE